MAIFRYGDRMPQISRESYISDTATVIGDVTIAGNCYIEMEPPLKKMPCYTFDRMDYWNWKKRCPSATVR